MKGYRESTLVVMHASAGSIRCQATVCRVHTNAAQGRGSHLRPRLWYGYTERGMQVYLGAIHPYDPLKTHKDRDAADHSHWF